MLNENRPLGTDLVSSLDDYIREDRREINKIWRALAGAWASETTHNMELGEFYLDIGDDLKVAPIELVNLSASGPVNLIQITKGSGGMLKVIRAVDSNVTIMHNPSYIDLADGENRLLLAGDMIVLINKGGDPELVLNGVWYELTSSGAGGAGPNYSSINMVSGQTSLTVGGQLSRTGVEVIGITADVSVSLATIFAGVSGQIKIFVAQDSDVTFMYSGSLTGGTFLLNSPAGQNYPMPIHDVLAMTNIGGDGGSTPGYWMELYRKRHGVAYLTI